MDLSKVEEVNFSGGLVPEGRVEMCTVQFDKDKRTTDKGNGYYNVTLEVISGQYAGSKCYDNIAVDGPDGYFLQRGKTAIKYILECTHQAHLKPHFYNVEKMSELNGAKIIVKFGIKPHTTKDGKNILVNEVKAYGTPRDDSSNHKLYVAWAKGEQLWETDALPTPPNAPRSNGVTGHLAAGAAFQAPHDLNDDIPL